MEETVTSQVNTPPTTPKLLSLSNTLQGKGNTSFKGNSHVKKSRTSKKILWAPTGFYYLKIPKTKGGPLAEF